MDNGQDTHYLLGLAEDAPVGTGAAMTLAIERMIAAEDFDGLALMSMAANVSVLEMGMDRLIAGR